MQKKAFHSWVCSKGLSQNNHLSRYLCTDAKEKPFICDVWCSKEFSWSDNEQCDIFALMRKRSLSFVKYVPWDFLEVIELCSHRQTHAKEKPFICEIWSFLISSNIYLKRHLCTERKISLRNTLIIHFLCCQHSQRYW